MKRAVEEREPALINLPVDLPSIPLVDPLLKPILTPIIDGPPQATSTTAATPPPPPTTTSGTGDGGESGGDSGGDSGSGNGGDSGGQSGGSGGNGNGGSSESGSNNGGQSSNGGSSTGGSGGGQTGSGGNSGAGSGPSTGNSGSPVTGNSSTHPSSTHSASQSGSTASPTGSRTSGSQSERVGDTLAGTGSSPVRIAQPTDSFAPSIAPTGTIAGPRASATSVSSGSSAGGPSSSGGGTTSTGNGNGGADGSDGGYNGNDTGATSSHKLSAGAIAGITVACLLAFLLLLIFLLRRRLIRRRNQRRNQWYAGAVSSSSYNFNNSPATPTSGLASARSSFATSYDISSPPTVDHHTQDVPDVPAVPLPQMAEIRDVHGPGTFSQRTYEHPTSPRSPAPAPILISVHDVDRRRESSSSMGSDASDPYTQRQVVYAPPDSTLLPPEPLTPMSVRPFSPTESFSFPKPPLDKRASDQWGSMTTRRQSSTTITAQSAYSGVDDAENPFGDPTPEPGFAEAETIRRPFLPSRDDELAVAPGDKVNVLRVFDDGWVAVHKISESQDIKGKGKAAEGGPGLIPVDCLREAGQKLPDFLASKRVSMYSLKG
ncbi:hypothetical protein VNI00_003632 [Paramarasmius palmivorus]|uniref:SH3 domain-containing protein n=1 Tax=Paramarasmius palmivorus TaxID=297713 RepID=A0AAW0DT00_9AGAR